MKHLAISLTFLFILSCTTKQLPWQTLDFDLTQADVHLIADYIRSWGN